MGDGAHVGTGASVIQGVSIGAGAVVGAGAAVVGDVPAGHDGRRRTGSAAGEQRRARVNRVYVIAEAGVNHNGSLELALQLVDAAAEAGADAVKFQTFRADTLVLDSAPKAAYQTDATGEGTQAGMLRSLELTEDDHRALIERCADRGIEFLSTPFDVESVSLLVELGVARMKMPSGHLTNVPFLRAVAATSLPVILSTGMATLDEVAEAMSVLEGSGCPRERIVLLHCTTEYPTPPEDVNLSAMLTLRDTFDVEVGYSDHTEGTVVPIAAAALGATILEKHFTLDRSLPGPDHRASLEPGQLAELVSAVRVVERAMGDGVKQPTELERQNAQAARTSIVAAKEIAAGEPFSAENLTTKRPGTGLSPFAWDRLVGRRGDARVRGRRADRPERRSGSERAGEAADRHRHSSRVRAAPPARAAACPEPRPRRRVLGHRNPPRRAVRLDRL